MSIATSELPTLRFDVELRKSINEVLNFGRYKGRTLSSTPMDYIRWLANPGTDRKGNAYNVPADISAIAQGIIDVDNTELTKALLVGKTGIAEDTVYVIERLGDLEGETVHESLDAAFAYLALEYPIEMQTDWGEEVGEGRSTPDPEDDRILIWEILPTGHKKVVGHFSGWHWNAEEFGLPQMTLPGDEDTLYAIAMKNY